MPRVKRNIFNLSLMCKLHMHSKVQGVSLEAEDWKKSHSAIFYVYYF